MLGFLSNRATAAHLALAAVAPLVLCKYIPADAVIAVLLWLALISLVWAFMSPSRNEGERTPDARRRYLYGSLYDPFFWVAVLILGYSAVTALNVGVRFGYDAESKIWSLLAPPVDILPGCVEGFGGQYFAASLLVLVLYPAIVHSINSRQSVYFVITSTTIVVIDAVFSFAAGFGIPGTSAAAYGLWALAAAASMFSAERSRRRPKEMLSAITLAGCFTALMFSGRPTVALVFVSATVLLAMIFSAFMCKELRFTGVVRALVLLLVAAAIAAGLFQWFSGDWESMIPVWKSEADPILKRLALESWEAHPWTGSGVGSFPLVAKIGATAEDWAVLGSMPDFYANGWRALLVERGMVGLLLLAAAIGAMAFMWFRYMRQRGLENFAAAVPLFPIALAAVSVVLVFDSSAMQVEALVAFVAVAAFSVNGGQ